MRIWTKEELEKANFGKFDCFGDFYMFKESYRLPKNMFGKSVEWCKKHGYSVYNWMIAKPTQQEPKEGDLVYVWDEGSKPNIPVKRIFLAKIKNGCVVVVSNSKKEYEKDLEPETQFWKHYEPIPKLTAQEIADKVGLSVEELRSIVNG